MKFVLIIVAVYFGLWQGLIEPNLPNHYFSKVDALQLFVAFLAMLMAHAIHVYSADKQDRTRKLLDANDTLSSGLSISIPTWLAFRLGQQWATVEDNVFQFVINRAESISGSYSVFKDDHPILRDIFLFGGFSFYIFLQIIVSVLIIFGVIFLFNTTIYSNVEKQNNLSGINELTLSSLIPLSFFFAGILYFVFFAYT